MLPANPRADRDGSGTAGKLSSTAVRCCARPGDSSRPGQCIARAKHADSRSGRRRVPRAVAAAVAFCSPADQWDCTAPAGHGGFEPQTPACPGSAAWPGVLLAYRPWDCTAPAGHGGFRPQTPASPGCGSGRLAGATAWPGVACCSRVDPGTARRRRDTSVSSRKRRPARAVLPGLACCSPRDPGTAQPRRDTAVSGRKRRLPRAVAVAGSLVRAEHAVQPGRDAAICALDG